MGDAPAAEEKPRRAPRSRAPKAAAPVETPEAAAPAPRDPWVNPSPLNLIIPASAWRTPDPQDAATERAAAEAEEALEAAIAAE